MKDVKFILRQVQIVIEDNQTKKADAFLHIFINGKTGIIYALIGEGVFPPLLNNLSNIFGYCGIDCILAVVEPKVFNSICYFLKADDMFTVAKLRDVEFVDKEMIEISIKRG